MERDDLQIAHGLAIARFPTEDSSANVPGGPRGFTDDSGVHRNDDLPVQPRMPYIK